MKVSRDRLLESLVTLGKIGTKEGEGRIRLVFSKEDFEARQYLISEMEDLKLNVRIDQVGNIIGRRPGLHDSLPVVAFGSHIDTVPNAGMLDGCYGVMAALEVVRTLNDNDMKTKHPLEIISFSDEEGVRFPLMIGSKTVCGLMNLQTAYGLKDSSGISYREALMGGGLQESSLAMAIRSPNEFKCWIELHIEQGPVLETENINIGIVEAIIGLVHLLVTIKGTAGHAGATPMNARRDPLVGAAEIVLEARKIGQILSENTRSTVGLLRVQPGAMNVIPAKVEMGIDFRDTLDDRLDRGIQQIRNIIEEICNRHGLQCTIEERAKLPPVFMSKEIMDSIQNAAKMEGASYTIMPSGAGHDTQNMAHITKTGMIFVPSRAGISHAPGEWTDPEYLALGANVLLNTILSQAGQS